MWKNTDLSKTSITFLFFLSWYFAAPRPTLGHSQGDSLTDPVLITAFWLFRSEFHREPPNEVGLISPTKRLVGFERGTFQFQSWRLIPLPGHSSLLHAKLMNVIFYKNQTNYYKKNICLRPFCQTISLNLFLVIILSLIWSCSKVLQLSLFWTRTKEYILSYLHFKIICTKININFTHFFVNLHAAGVETFTGD